MTKRRVSVYVLCVLGVLLVGVSAVWLLRGDAETIDRFETVARPAKTHPDYADTVIPPNICPMNFVVDEPGEKYCVKLTSKQGKPVEVFSRSPGIVIPVKPWRELLGQNRGEKLSIEVYVKGTGGVWRRFAPVENTVAAEPIDAYLVYREMPTYNLIWSNMGIYERNLEGYGVRPVLNNRSFGRGCCNCHTFSGNSAGTMAMNVRGVKTSTVKGGLLIARDGVVTRVVNTATPFNPVPAIYLAWHPSGKAIAFSSNKVNQTFHDTGENRHSVDSWSDMGLYLLESNQVTTDPRIARPDVLETSPWWSPDGKYLYFCSAKRLPIHDYSQFRYDMVRIAYDVETHTWGPQLETVVTTDDTKPSIARPAIPPDKKDVLKSVAQPVVSPDGRFILFCIAAFGNFPVYQETSDLYILDLETKECRPLDAANSDRSDSWHSWSSNGRWIVFSSKRPAGLMARPHIAYVDTSGRARKPFILPQKDPTFYTSYVRTFNFPMLITGPIPLSQRQILRALNDPDKQVQAQLDPALRKPDGTTGATTPR
ncbi:MAG TPA: hypothetical protein VMZ92_11925 [Planctomycetota bacterium]|nr:hypothetical protein [Planctomycetota bacterium]